MTLGEIVSLVADKVNMGDAKTRALIRRFAERRHEMLARMGLWRELLGMWEVYAEPGQREVVCPELVDRVVGLRVNATGDQLENRVSQNVGPVDALHSFMTDPGLWERLGAPAGFASLPSVATNYRYRTDRWPEKDTTSTTISVVSDSPEDVDVVVTLEGDAYGQRLSERLQLMGTTPVHSQKWYQLLYAVTKSGRTRGRVSVIGGSSDHYGQIEPEELSAPRYRRIRLLEAPRERTRLVLLGKRHVPPLREDGDSTAFDGLDLALEALVLADVYEWLRQTQDAAEKRQEAMAMLEVLKREEFYQEAQQQRLVPQVWGSEMGEYAGLHGGI